MGATTIAVAGSTGSIGTQAIEVVQAQPDRFEVVALGAWSSVDALVAQAAELRPKLVIVGATEPLSVVARVVAEKATAPSRSSAGWETIMFDEPVHMEQGEQRVIWITTHAQRDVSRNGYYFVEPNNVSPGGLITAQYPSSRYNANGYEPGTENIPPISTSPTTSEARWRP